MATNREIVKGISVEQTSAGSFIEPEGPDLRPARRPGVRGGQRPCRHQSPDVSRLRRDRTVVASEYASGVGDQNEGSSNVSEENGSTPADAGARRQCWRAERQHDLGPVC